MKNKFFIFAIFLALGTASFAQSIQQPDEPMGFTRGSGFCVRAELYSGLFAEMGYQFNPFVQVGGGFGFGFDGGIALMFGVRTYTNDSNWAGMFDYHVGLVSFQGYSLLRHTIVGGVSFKDFDIGAGIMYLTDTYDSAIGLSITLGYNFRCYEHR